MLNCKALDTTTVCLRAVSSWEEVSLNIVKKRRTTYMLSKTKPRCTTEKDFKSVLGKKKLIQFKVGNDL